MGICVVSRNSLDVYDKIHIITEYLSGGNLVVWMKRLPPLPNNEKDKIYLKIAKGVSSGMDHLHKNEIIHRDLGSRNVLVSTSLTYDSFSNGPDFLLWIVKDGTLVAVRWAAPEILENGPKASSQSFDVWAFGILLYEIMCSCKFQPYPTRSNHEVILQVLSGISLKPPIESNHVLSSLMSTCLTPLGFRPKFSEISKLLQHLEKNMSENTHTQPHVYQLYDKDEQEIEEVTYKNINL